MKPIDADNLRGRVCEIFLCAEPGSAEERRLALILGLIDSEPTIAPPPNDPLTPEELREMDGEPVWVVTGSTINAGRGHWDVCDWWDKETVMFPYSGEQPRIEDCGITWAVYRRKPEEG